MFDVLKRLSLSTAIVWSVTALTPAAASSDSFEDLEKQFAHVRPNCFLTVSHGNNVYINDEALAEFLYRFNDEYVKADTSANLDRLRAERKTLEAYGNPESHDYTFFGINSEECQRVLQLARDLRTGQDTPFTRGESPEHTFVLLAWYFHEWEHIQKSCEAINSKIKKLLAEKKENQSILQYLQENKPYFPAAWDNTALALLDRFTSKEAGNKNEALSRGVVMMTHYLQAENERLMAEIFAFSEEHLLLVHRVSKLSQRLNNPCLRKMVKRSKKLLQETRDKLPLQEKPLFEKESKLVRGIQAHYQDKQEKLSHTQRDAITKITSHRKHLTNPNIRKVLDECAVLKNANNSVALNDLLQEVRPISQAVLDLKLESYRVGCLHKFLEELPSKEDLREKSLTLFETGQGLTVDGSTRELHDALDILKNGFNKELTQITNDLIENNAKGFFWENFVRWLLVARTEGIVPPLVAGAITKLEAKLNKPVDTNPVEETRSAVKPDHSPDYKFSVSQVSTLHFPPQVELQRNRGRVAEALICVIRNLPNDLFKEMVEQRVLERLDEYNRAEWVKSVSAYVAKFGADMLVNVIKDSLIDMIKRNSGDPALLALCNPKIDDLLALRVAANEDQSEIGKEILRLRDAVVPSLQADIASLATLEKEEPGRIRKLITSAVGTVYPEPVELTWDAKMQQQLFMTKNNLLVHVKELGELRSKMRMNSRPASPKRK